VVIDRSSGPPGNGSLTIASAKAGAGANARVAPAVLRNPRRDERWREESARGTAAPPIGLTIAGGKYARFRLSSHNLFEPLTRGLGLSSTRRGGAEEIFRHPAGFIGGPLVIELGNTLADRRILGSSFERVIGEMAGEPHFARSCELSRTAQQDPGTACEGGDLPGQRLPLPWLQFARPPAPPAGVVADDVPHMNSASL
jgi:hypothetical protein